MTWSSASRHRFQPAAVAQLDLVEAPGALGQDGIEKELVAALRAFRALPDRLTAAMSGTLDARDLVAGERRAIERRVRKVVRRAGRVHGVGNAPAPHEFHRARIERGGARMVRWTFALLDEETGRAAHAEIRRERKPDRAAADDQDRSFQCWAG